MINMINHVVVEGRLGRDPECVPLKNGRFMTRFDIAHSGDSTTWIPIRVFGHDYSSKFRKGQLVGIKGTLRQRKLTINGKKVDYLYIRPNSVEKM